MSVKKRLPRYNFDARLLLPITSNIGVAFMGELADPLHSKCNAERRPGASPGEGTKKLKMFNVNIFFSYTSFTGIQ